MSLENSTTVVGEYAGLELQIKTADLTGMFLLR
jgi:hypothetical protein